MFDKKQKTCIKRIHLVTDDGLYDWKAFYKVEIVFIPPLKNKTNKWFVGEIAEKIRTYDKLNKKILVLRKNEKLTREILKKLKNPKTTRLTE